ncbi:MAG: hypothetical protein L3J52_05915 [Proteobacteria bacterium]|nr:hypothetical protein [Pseudomonadota bacterium]
MGTILTKYSWVDDPDDVIKLAHLIEEDVFCAVDTEFERTRTFYLNPALLQLMVSGHAYLVDLAQTEQIDRLFNQLNSIIIHSGSEDIELWLQFSDNLPRYIFDTQVAASLCGFNLHTSYQGLVKSLLGIEIDKSESRSDWLHRPLSDKQISYAIQDIVHLPAMKQILEKQLNEKGMSALFEHLMMELKQKVSQDVHIGKIFLKILKSDRLSLINQKRLWRLLIWRDKMAKKRNRPRNWILNPQQMSFIVKSVHEPGDFSGGKFHEKFIEYNAKDIINNLDDSENIEDDELPRMVKLTQSQGANFQNMRAKLQQLCETAQMPPSLIANKEQLKRLAFEDKSLDDLAAWRLIPAV